jgi:transcriptional regulator with XRE-family HTH domain
MQTYKKSVSSRTKSEMVCKLGSTSTDKALLQYYLRIALGDTLKWHRWLHRLTQQELADLCDFERVYISRMERGKVSPSLTVIFVVCEYLKINASEFIAEVAEVAVAFQSVDIFEHKMK